jgi:integrase
MASLLRPWVVRYLDADGRQVRKGTPGASKVKRRAAKWYGQYVDADGNRRRAPLSTDKVAARQMLAELERNAEHRKAGLVDRFAEQRKTPIDTHLADYETHLSNKGVSGKHLSETMRRLRAVLDHCGIRKLADLCPEGVEGFLAALEAEKASARTRNTYLSSARAFSRWCVRSRRVAEDAMASLQAASGDPVRQRRSLTEAELIRLLQAARERPLLEVMTLRTGKRKGQCCAKVQSEVKARLERLGRERSLMYKTAILTGLRRGELAALEVRHLSLAGSRPCVALPGEETKNGKEADLPLRADLADDLRRWVEETRKGPRDKLFCVPVELVKILKRDLKLAGIPYRDEHGRTFDVHAMRHTTSTYMGKGKVTPRVAQQFMRHCDIKLTLQTYADVRLLDEAEALAALPSLEPISVRTASGDRRTESGSEVQAETNPADPPAEARADGARQAVE